jgi:ribonuclease R
MYLFDKESYTDQQRLTLKDNLKEITKLSSKNEVIAIECEREVNAMKIAEYMTRHIGEEFIGFVSNINSFGAFVELDNTIEGLIRLQNFKDDFYTYVEATNELIGRTKGQRFTLGTKVKIRVIGADKQTRRVDFELVEHLGNR